jgi:protoporphyrinogen oxidase
VEAVRCVLSFFRARVSPPRDRSNLEGYIVGKYGWRLYEHFFRSYNEKVWGVPASQLSADWGAQRIKGMSLWQAVWEPIRGRILRLRGGRRSAGEQITSLIEEFRYPRLGPGMMWERCRDLVIESGGAVEMDTRVVAVHRGQGGAEAVTCSRRGTQERVEGAHFVSSMPISALVAAMDPPAPEQVLEAAHALKYRDFLTVALVVPEREGFPDNWIYVHYPGVKVGRIQNFGAWSPDMVKEGRTCLGLEYFVFEGDDLWSAPDEELVGLATKELAEIGLVHPGSVEAGYVVRMPKAYPVYDEGYQRAVDVLRRWIESEVPNVHPVGRNGMHKYNNQDHSMLTAMLTVENIVHGARHDVWAVNVDDEYHEEGPARVEHLDGRPGEGGTGGGGTGEGGTGRGAPVVPADRSERVEAASS